MLRRGDGRSALPGREPSVERRTELRWVRALTLASVMLAAGLSGHVAGGGTATPPSLLGPLLLVVSLAVAPFLGAPASVLRVVVLVLVAQAGLHVALSLIGSTPAAEPMTMGPGHTMPPPAQIVPAHLSMLAAHAAAALVVALWLAAGERAAWSLVAVVTLALADAWRVVCHVVTVPVAVVTVRRAPALAWTTPVTVSCSVWDGHGRLARRGPPYACAS